MKSKLCNTSQHGYARPLSLLIAATLILTLCACGGGEHDLLGNQKQDFQAQVRGEWRGTAFEGTLVHAVPSDAAESGDTDENSRPATVILTFSAPNAWRGITLTLSEDRATMALGELSYDMTGEIGGTWFEIPALFTAKGDVTSVSAADGGVTEVTFTASDGGRVTVTLDGETGELRRIEGACGWVEVG